MQVLGRSLGARLVGEADNEDKYPAAIHAKHRLGRYPVLAPGEDDRAYRRLWEWIFNGAHEGRSIAPGPPHPRARNPATHLRRSDQIRLPGWPARLPAIPARRSSGRRRHPSPGDRQVDPCPVGAGVADVDIRCGRSGAPAPPGECPGQLDGGEPQGCPELDARDTPRHPSAVPRSLGRSATGSGPDRVDELEDRALDRGPRRSDGPSPELARPHPRVTVQ